MLDAFYLLNNVGEMIHAIGDVSIVKQMSLTDYLGIPEFADALGEAKQYTFEYSDENTRFAGVCESGRAQLHCKTNLLDSSSRLTEIKDIINMKTNNVPEEIVRFYEEKIKQVTSGEGKQGMRVTWISKPY